MSPVTPQQVVLVAAVAGALVAYVAATVSIRRRENRAAAAAWYAQQTATRGEGWNAPQPDVPAVDYTGYDAWLDMAEAVDNALPDHHVQQLRELYLLEEDAR